MDDVELSWSGGGQAFWVYRCDGSPCSGEWLRLTAEPVIERTFRDTTALAPGVPQAPTLRVTNDSRHADLSWDTVVAPSAPRYSYRVTAVVDGVESTPSAEATGHRAERPVTGYEVSVAQGDWVELGSVTTWRDESAEPPALSLSGVEASQGDFAGYVELVASGVVATAGPTRSYRVRAVTDFGPGASAEMTYPMHEPRLPSRRGVMQSGLMKTERSVRRGLLLRGLRQMEGAELGVELSPMRVRLVGDGVCRVIAID